METTFYIQLTVQTPEGPDSFGRFSIGNDREAAVNIFRQMKGSPVSENTHLLLMELMETVSGLPVNLQLISCTLDEVACNCRLISKELFQLINLKA